MKTAKVRRARLRYGSGRSQFADRNPLGLRAGIARTFSFVIAGLDPAIHAATSLAQIRRMA